MSGIEDTHLDVLQNIEFAIVGVCRADAALHDLDVLDAVDALVRHYHAEEEQRQPPAANLADRARCVFTSVRKICEWRLGRNPLPAHAEMPGVSIPVAELVECLRRIQKSVRRWNRVGGRQGYLEFVSRYVE
jgi:hypothetical protein